jgi:hypothetical protein
MRKQPTPGCEQSVNLGFAALDSLNHHLLYITAGQKARRR